MKLVMKLIIKTHNLVQWSMLFFVLVLLSSCSNRNTRYFPPIKLKKAVLENKKNVILAAQLMSEQEQDDYFGINLLESGYCVVLLRIENRSSGRCVFRPSYCDMPRESGYEIAPSMHYDTYARVVWGCIPALVFWWPAIPFFIIPHALYWSNYNWTTSNNIARKTLEHDETFVVEPYETVQKLLFIKEENFIPVFDIALFNETDQELMVYTVDLRNKTK